MRNSRKLDETEGKTVFFLKQFMEMLKFKIHNFASPFGRSEFHLLYCRCDADTLFMSPQFVLHFQPWRLLFTGIEKLHLN